MTLVALGLMYVKPDVYESVHRDTIMKVTNKMQLYRLIYYSQSTLHVSEDVFAHRQEHLNVFTVSGSIHPSGYRLVNCKYIQMLLMMGENIARNT